MHDMDFLESFVKAGETSVSNLLLHHYHDYGLTTGQLVVYLQLKSDIDRGIGMPDIAEVAKRLGTTSDKVYSQIQQMMAKGILKQEMRTDDQGQEEAYYDFSPLLARMSGTKVAGKQKGDQPRTSREELYSTIESEFGRPLSPLEMETVADWVDQDRYSPEMIVLALKEAVMNGKLRLKYVDSILLNWQQNNLKTPADVTAEKKRFNEQRANRVGRSKTGDSKPSQEKIPIFKLDGLKKSSPFKHVDNEEPR
jgi:DNA replication protein